MGADSGRTPTCDAQPLWLAILAAVASGLAVTAVPRAAGAEERVELIPDEKAGWSPSNLFSFASGGYYSDRTLRIETSPPGAKLDLFYVRASFQKRYEQAVAPVIVDATQALRRGQARLRHDPRRARRLSDRDRARARARAIRTRS